MAYNPINLGEGPGQGDADNLYDAFTKVNENLYELFNDKADETHTHEISQVLQLQDTLDEKALAGDIKSSELTMVSGRLVGRTTTGTGALEELTGAQVKTFLSLQNVSNTSDADKPVSNAGQAALDLKENVITAAATLPATKYWRGDKSWQTLDKTTIGLANVDNTSDANKPISTLVQAALDLKQGNLPGGTNSQFLRGDKTFVAVTKSDVGLGNVNNTSDAQKPVFTATVNGQVTAPGETDFTAGNKYLASNGTWKSVSKSDVGLSNVQNTSDDQKPISTAQQAALDDKADSEHTHLAQDITDLTKSSVGLSNVDNTSDADKPVSTAVANVLQGYARGNEIVKAIKFFYRTSAEMVSSNARYDIVAAGNINLDTLARSKATALVADTSEVVFGIKKNNVVIGSVTFAANSTLGVIDIPNSANRTFSLCDIVEVVPPAQAPTGLEGVAIVLRS